MNVQIWINVDFIRVQSKFTESIESNYRHTLGRQPVKHVRSLLILLSS